MDTGLQIIICLAALGITIGIIYYFKTQKDQKRAPRSKKERVKAFAPVLFIFGISNLLSWHWEVGNIYALYFGVAFIVGTLIIWVMTGSDKTNT